VNLRRAIDAEVCMTDRKSGDFAWGRQTRRPLAKKPLTLPLGLLAGVAMLLSAGNAQPTSAETLAVVADATVANGQPNEARGGLSTLQVGASGKTRVVVRFDQADLATALDGGVLQMARLELFITFNQNNWTPEGRPVDVSRLTGAWNESTVTWNCADDLDTSNNQANCTPEWDGGTYATEPTDVVIHDNGMTGWVSWDVTADVAAFLQGTPNHGWVIHKRDEARNGRADYGSREGATGQAPRLVLTVAAATATVTPLTTGTVTPSATPLPPSPTPSDTPTAAPTPTDTPTDTPTATPTHTDTPTATPTHTDTPTATPTNTDTPTITPTSTPTSTPTPDTVAPVITIVSPPDGLVTNQAAQTIAGTLNEPATLTIDGDPVAVQPDLTFSVPVTLVEGPNVYSFVATDPFANAGSATHNLTLDTAAPAAIEGFELSDLAPDDGITVSAPPGTVDAGSTVEVTNTRTGQVVTVAVAADGSFIAPSVTAVMDDVLEIVVVDAAGNRSTASQAVAGPPDPAVVAPPVDRTVASAMIDTVSFLYAGDDPVQVGLTEPIEAERIAVLRGEVTDRDGNPLRAVKVSVLDHPEYGHTRTRNDGTFDLVVNGGGTLTLVYEEAGRFPVQRTVTVPWQETTQIPPIAMIEPDPVVTLVPVGAAAPQTVVVGSPEAEEPGTERTGVAIFPAGVIAEVVDGATGNRIPLSSLDVRITEFTVGELGPEAMPGELPPTSAYTYAFEITAGNVALDPDDRIELTPPVPYYVDNFIGFPVGDPRPSNNGPLAVPLGWYDRERARWVASENGIVMEVVSVDQQGVAQIDVDGDGDADSADETILAQYGVTTAERVVLAGRYQPGASVWRVGLPFLAPWDCNFPGGPPSDVILPNGGAPSGGTGRVSLDDPDISGDGEIDFQNQALLKTHELVGTPFSLSYRRDRQLDRALDNPLTIPVTGDTVHPDVLRAEVIIQVAGRDEIRIFENTPSNPLPTNLTTTFTWDGLDAYGRLLQGRVPVRVRIHYLYPMIFQVPVTPSVAFAMTSGIDFGGTTFNPRSEVAAAQDFRGFVGGWDAREEGLGGWSLDVHRVFDPVTRQMTGGGAAQRTAEQIGSVVETAIGGGSVITPIDGVTRARDLSLNSITGVAIDARGRVYVAQVPALAANRRIFRVNEDGTVTTVVGGGSSLSDGAEATQAQINPRGIAFGPDGKLYFAEYPGSGTNPHRVRRVDLEATPALLETVAGTTSRCSTGNTGAQCGDGGPANAALLDRPENVRVAEDGTMYITDRIRRIRRVGPDGIIWTIAGEGNAITEGEPSTGAGFFNSFIDIAIAEDGTLYVSGTGAKVHRINTGGRIYTVAGSGTAGDEGDGGPATSAQLFSPGGLAIGRDGSLYVADTSYDRVRSIGPTGIITALAGRRVPLNSTGIDGENGPAMAARFDQPNRLAVAPDGTLYIADTGNNRIRKVTPPLPGLSEVGDTIIASPDGSELYVFNPRGRHERTVDTLAKDGRGNPVVIWGFAYDDPETGFLTAVTDRDGNVTTFERGVAGGDLVITGPFGQETVITLDANGYVASIANPGGETTSFQYTPDGLMTKVTDPRSNDTDYAYTAEGRLESTADPVGGGHTLTRTDIPGGFEVLAETAEEVQTGYRVEFQSTGDELRTTLLPDGTQRTALTAIDQSTTVTEPDGTIQISKPGPDPRFGMQAAVPQSTQIDTPGGLTADIQATSAATITNPADPLSLTSQTDTVSVNTRQVTRTYNAASRTYTDTTPEGRQTLTTLDTKGRVRKTQLAGVHPTRQEYDAQGRVIRVKEGPDPDTAETRVTEFDYVNLIDIAFGYPQQSQGQLKSVTDALGRTVTFEYDDDVRVSKQILPDGREIGFSYDGAGNVTQVIPPGRPPHDFTYTQINLEQTYEPPQVTPPLATVTTTTTYTADGQVDLITRPDGKQIDFTYDAAGRVDAITLQPSGEVRDYGYEPTTGNLAQITGADAALTFAYDGSLQTTETWSGAEIATASVTRTYDDSFRVQALQVNGETPVTYVYDDDDLLIQAGNLILTRDPANGLLTGTSITEGAGTIDDSYEYDDFGQLTHYEARHNGVPILEFEYTRDDLGRIESILETKNTTGTPVAKETHYQYDLAGRLYRVCPDAGCTTVLSEYQYDPNGNRIAGSFNSQGTITSAVYDDQDRLHELTQGPTTTTYAYTDNGELLTKTDPSGTTTYEYDQLGNLLSITPPSGPPIEYLIDARNRRTGKKVGAILEKQWIYQGQLNPVAELDGSGNLVSEFVYAAKSNVPSYIIRHDDPAPGQTTTYQVLSDHLGSVRVVAGIDGASLGVVEEIEYDEFGIANSASTFQPFEFAGGLAGSGLIRFGARDYAPTLGRWIAKDPVDFFGGDTNLFAYVQQDPLSKIDPSGLDATLGGNLGAIAAAGVVADIAINIRVRFDQDLVTVSVPPPSTFELGFPLPFFFGVDFAAQSVDIPIIGIVGIPTDFVITADPIARAILQNQPKS